ncbi:MAG TPA: Trp biosynthesis-associated membrane protein [Marmoricola sp.]
MAEPSRRRGFGVTVLGGLVTAALCAVASAKPWYALSGDRPVTGVPESQTRIDMPLALALALVVLAGWGALLVSRGIVRRACATVAVAAAVGVVACVVTAPFTLPDDLRSGLPASSVEPGVGATGWFVTAAIVSVLSTLVLVEAWRRAPSWPTMGTRYDAPATRSAQVDDTDLWKALDEGRDPTSPGEPASP